MIMGVSSEFRRLMMVFAQVKLTLSLIVSESASCVFTGSSTNRAPLNPFEPYLPHPKPVIWPRKGAAYILPPAVVDMLPAALLDNAVIGNSVLYASDCMTPRMFFTFCTTRLSLDDSCMNNEDGFTAKPSATK